MRLNDLIHQAQKESVQPYLCRVDKSKTRKDFMMEKFKELLADELEKQKAFRRELTKAAIKLGICKRNKKDI